MEPAISFNVADIAAAIMGIFILVTTLTGLILKYKGLLTFGRPLERRNCVKNCADHPDMVKDMALITQKVSILEARQVEVLSKITTVDERVGRIDHSIAELVGYLRGKRNGYP